MGKKRRDIFVHNEILYITHKEKIFT